MNKHIAFAALLLIPFSVFAQTPAGAMGGGSDGARVLDGHLFPPSDVVADPFTATYLDESTGFGYAGLSADQIDSGGNNVGKSPFQFGTLGQQFAFQLGIQGSWAVRMAAAGTVLSGIDADSALIGGATVGYSLSTGVTYSFLVGKIRLAGAFDLEYAPLYTFSPVTALLNTLNTSTIDADTLFTSSDNIRLRPAFVMAMGLSPSLGLRAVIDYEQEFVRSTENSSDGAFDIGAALDYDLHALTPLPLGLLAGYKLTVPTSSGDNWGHQFTLGLFYTGQRNLGLGIQTLLQLPPAVPAGISDYVIFGASLTLRYYWS